MKSKQLIAVASYPAIVGAVLSATRKHHDHPQIAMSQAIGTNVSTWSRIESGESALTIEQLARAAYKLGVEPSAILRKADEKVAELSERGIETTPDRTWFLEDQRMGAVPLVGASLLSVIGVVGSVTSAIKKFRFRLGE